MTPDFDISDVKQIGHFYSRKLRNLKISTVQDLLNHFPSRYVDFTNYHNIQKLRISDNANTQGKLTRVSNIYTRNRKFMTSAQIEDETGSVNIIWFNQPFLVNSLKTGQMLSIAGKVDFFSNKMTFINPEYEIFTDKKALIHTAGLVPVYPETRGVSSKWLRARMRNILAQFTSYIEDFLPQEVLKRNQLISLLDAYLYIHSPKSLLEIEKAKKRFAFDEIVMTYLGILNLKTRWHKEYIGIPMQTNRPKIDKFKTSLPFQLTSSQTSAIEEIFTDMQKEYPMNRILQGDVGSGKTIISAFAIYLSYLNGFQSVLMAPTTILAKQHFDTLKSIFEQFGLKIGLWTSKTKMTGNFDLVIGTHALLSVSDLFENLGLTIIDEQHRFGVRQRALMRSHGKTPHVLTMTATPIPRTLALTIYGNLDITSVSELPANRKEIKTYVVPPTKRDGAYDFIRKNVSGGMQVFILCPLIEESDNLVSVKAATSEYERLKENVFPNFRLGLVHGKLKSTQKDEILVDFRNRKIDILVATPVVEVGIDIPGANIMLVEASERFGLASLHQLRGRVGRGSEQAYCLLFSESKSERVINKLKQLEKTASGSELAELDLKYRGQGEIYGTAQSGTPIFKFADISDRKFLEEVRKESGNIYQKIKTPSYKRLYEQIRGLENIAPD